MIKAIFLLLVTVSVSFFIFTIISLSPFINSSKDKLNKSDNRSRLSKSGVVFPVSQLEIVFLETNIFIVYSQSNVLHSRKKVDGK